MKKLILLGLSLLLFCEVSAQDRTEKTQSVHFNLLGLHYNYTIPVGKKWTISPHAGFSGELGWSGSNYFSWNDDELEDNGHWFYSILGNIGVDVRYYYNLSRRMSYGRVTDYNSGNFFGIDFQYMPPAILKHNIDGEWRVVAYPCWGVRRVYQSKYLMEVTIGALTGVQGGDWGIKGPKFDIRIGYVF